MTKRKQRQLKTEEQFRLQFGIHIGKMEFHAVPKTGFFVVVVVTILIHAYLLTRGVIQQN